MKLITLFRSLLQRKDYFPVRGRRVCRLESGAYTVRPNTMSGLCRTPR